jgi:hypothetical protein
MEIHFVGKRQALLISEQVVRSESATVYKGILNLVPILLSEKILVNKLRSMSLVFYGTQCSLPYSQEPIICFEFTQSPFYPQFRLDVSVSSLGWYEYDTITNTSRFSFKKIDRLLLFFIFTMTKKCTINLYRGADKSLARPGRKQATATEDFDVHISYL